MSVTKQTQIRNIQRRKLSQCVDNATKIIKVLQGFIEIYEDQHETLAGAALYSKQKAAELQDAISNLRSSF